MALRSVRARCYHFPPPPAFIGNVHNGRAAVYTLKLTIAYITARHEPHLDWFFSSLAKQIKPEDDLEIIVIDFFAQACDGWTDNDISNRGVQLLDSARPVLNIYHNVKCFPPKPNVWQGPHRITKDNWWSVSNARNTALCKARGEYIVFTDDRGLLMPGWMDAVRRAMETKTVLCGSYKKVADLVVEDGLFKSCGDVLGIDPRTHQPKPDDMGSWAFGCGLGVPLDWALEVNGYDDDCDGMGYEDVIFGLMLSKHGFPITYDPSMIIVEDRTPNDSIGPIFKRKDPGVSPHDKSHSILNMVLGGARVKAPNYFGKEGIRGMRARVQAGEPFPICQVPQHEWFSGISLKHLHEYQK